MVFPTARGSIVDVPIAADVEPQIAGRVVAVMVVEIKHRVVDHERWRGPRSRRGGGGGGAGLAVASDGFFNCVILRSCFAGRGAHGGFGGLAPMWCGNAARAAPASGSTGPAIPQPTIDCRPFDILKIARSTHVPRIRACKTHRWARTTTRQEALSLMVSVIRLPA